MLNKNMKPILLGRLNQLNNDLFSITGHLGDVENIEENEYFILKSMDGFHTLEDISQKHKVSLDEVNKLFKKYNGNKKLSDLESWNQVGWCETCHVHVAGDVCSLCNAKAEKILFSPPCDPFICFEEEQKFILDVLKTKFCITLPEDALLIANNGIKDDVFFWEVAYKKDIILKIIFTSVAEETWKYELNSIAISTEQPLRLNDETIKKIIDANVGRQNSLYKKSEVFIRECVQFFDTKPLIYFSGGKESLVMLSLFDQFDIEANVITVLTGVEFPEDDEFVRSYKTLIDSNRKFNYYFFEDNGQTIIDYLNDKKVLSAKDPWCRVSFKKELKNKGTKLIYNGDVFIACEGSRWYENDFRRRHTKVNFINDYKHQVWIHPIAEWTSFDVWTYIFKNNIPVNPVYKKGFQRTTCWLCPIVNPFHLKCSQKYYPELWQKIKNCKMEAFGDDQSKDLPY